MSEDVNSLLYGNDLFGQPNKPESRGKISDKFLLPPFTVLNAREGFWQDRKRMWQSIGIKSEVGRSKSLSYAIPLKAYSQDNMASEYYGEEAQSLNTSIFDPVLTEAAYTWFCPKGGTILDPFCGGSVRGIVASCLGYNYNGIDLRREQIESNIEQGKAICNQNVPNWICGDSTEIVPTVGECDFVFSCPPYGDLEVYSDDPKDLSSMEYHTFVAAYKRIILKSCAKLRDNRFACFVVGDFRDKKGFYRGFTVDTINAFRECGLELYNEAILVTSVGSTSMRIDKQFEASRKMGKTHQNVFVFVKGDPKIATQTIINSKKDGK